jgi:transcriptional regulator with XRE-family HTH domain
MYRESRGLSEGALAELLGVHARYLAGLESGEHNLTLQRVERIAARIGVDPLALFASRD